MCLANIIVFVAISELTKPPFLDMQSIARTLCRRSLLSFSSRPSRDVTPRDLTSPWTRTLSTKSPWELGILNHTAIAVPDLDRAVRFYRDVLRADVSPAQDLPEHGVTVVFVNLPNTKIELLYPLGEKSPIAGFLQKNKDGGIHHVCIEVTIMKNPLFSNFADFTMLNYPSYILCSLAGHFLKRLSPLCRILVGRLNIFKI